MYYAYEKCIHFLDGEYIQSDYRELIVNVCFNIMQFWKVYWNKNNLYGCIKTENHCYLYVLIRYDVHDVMC